MPLNENSELLTTVVLTGLLVALCLYATAWFWAWRRWSAAFVGFWLAGSALVVAAGTSPLLLRIRFATSEVRLGDLEMAARLFLVVTTMGAFIPLAVIAGAALFIGGLIFLISRALA